MNTEPEPGSLVEFYSYDAHPCAQCGGLRLIWWEFPGGLGALLDCPACLRRESPALHRPEDEGA